MAIISGNKSSLNKKKKDFESKFRMNAPKDQDDALLKIVRVSPQLAKEIGLIPSILLLQFEFWLHVYTHEMDGRRWFYMTTEEMHEELQFVSEPTIRRAVNKLRQLNLIIVGRYNKRKEDRTNWYSINTDAIQELKSISWADDQIDQITDQNEISSADDGGPAQDYAEARAAATAYAKGRNANTRIRSYPQENASQREGVQAAISWLDRKRKSAIRK